MEVALGKILYFYISLLLSPNIMFDVSFAAFNQPMTFPLNLNSSGPGTRKMNPLRSCSLFLDEGSVFLRQSFLSSKRFHYKLRREYTSLVPRTSNLTSISKTIT